MTDEERLNQFVQDVYLTRYNRLIDDITDEDGQIEVAKTLRWANMFLDEIESEKNPDGSPIDWLWTRTNDNTFGTIATVSDIFDLPAGVRRIVINPERPLVLMFGGSIISRYETVDANQITRRTVYPITDRVAVVKNKLVFSRPFKDYEIGAEVMADTIETLPRLVLSPINVDLLDVIPYQLLVLGTAKNAVLPDIVQGGLTPSFVQKYGDELDKAIAENNASSTADEVVRDDYSSIGGIF